MPDPVLGSIATKVAASALGAALRGAITSMWQYYKSNHQSALPDRYAVAEMGRFLETQFAVTLPETTMNYKSIQEYLGSPECATLLEHMFAFHMGGRSITKDGPLGRELETGLTVYGIADLDVRYTLFSILEGSIRKVLKGAEIGSDTELKDKAQERLQRSIVETYLQSIDSQVATLSRTPPLTGPQIENLLATYKEVLRRIVGQIQPPNFDGAETVPIDNLYVSPLMAYSNRHFPTSSLYALLQTYRAVVLGDPGGGKTTLTRKIAYNLATVGAPELTRGTEPLVPVIVTLREFESAFQRKPVSVIEYISDLLRTTYQVDLSVSSIEWLTLTGRLYVIFDGLDELLDTTRRRAIADIVVAFGTAYPSVRILVTSRRVGYLEAPLPRNVYETVTLDAFGQQQVREYVTKWFSLESQASKYRQAELARNFLRESTDVHDLRTNPLMLALMCTIYRTELYIPRNRPDVYEKCSRMLFDRWDRHRGLRKSFEFEAHIEPALMHLAYFIYRNQALHGGVPERALVKEAADYLKKWQYDDRAKAVFAAEEFVSFCRGRAWVFTDVGLSGNDDRMYQFTHRTFLEYFTASHLARVAPNIERLVRFLVPRIQIGEWDVVAQLALQIKTKPIHAGADTAARVLLDYVLADDDLRLRINVAAFLVRSMSFLITSPAVTRSIANGLVRLCCEGSSNAHIEQWGMTSVTGVVPPTFEALRGVARENGIGIVPYTFEALPRVAREVRETLIQSIEDSVRERLTSTDGYALEVACAVASRFDSLHDQANGTTIPSSQQELLSDVAGPIIARHVRAWPWAAVSQFYDGSMAEKALRDRIAFEELVACGHQVPGYPARYYPPGLFAAACVKALNCDRESHQRFEEMLALTRHCAKQILRGKRPRIEKAGGTADFQIVLDPDVFNDVCDEDQAYENRTLLDEELLDACLVVALAFERHERESSVAWHSETLQHNLGRLAGLSPVFAARVGNKSGLDLLPYTDGAARPLLLDWAHHREDLWS